MNKDLINAVLITAIAVNCACNSRNQSKSSNKKFDGSVNEPVSVTMEDVSANSYDKQFALLQGIWALGKEENAEFTIEGDQVIYFDSGDEEANKNIHFKIRGDSLSINYDGAFVVTDFIRKLTKDSLVLYGKNRGVTRLIRIK